MKDKVFNYWEQSSYRRRSLIAYIFFSLLAMFSRFFDDNLGMLSSMIAIGFVVAIGNVIVSICYILYLALIGKSKEKGSFSYIMIVALFLALVSLITPKEKSIDPIKEPPVRVIKQSIHNVAAIPILESRK